MSSARSCSWLGGLGTLSCLSPPPAVLGITTLPTIPGVRSGLTSALLTRSGLFVHCCHVRVNIEEVCTCMRAVSFRSLNLQPVDGGTYTTWYSLSKKILAVMIPSIRPRFLNNPQRLSVVQATCSRTAAVVVLVLLVWYPTNTEVDLANVHVRETCARHIIEATIKTLPHNRGLKTSTVPIYPRQTRMACSFVWLSVHFAAGLRRMIITAPCSAGGCGRPCFIICREIQRYGTIG